jgi:hypothetical protein
LDSALSIDRDAILVTLPEPDMTPNPNDFVASLVFGAIGGIILTLIQYLFPKPVPDISEGPITENDVVAFRRHDSSIILPTILAVPFLMCVWFLAFNVMAALFDHRLPGTTFLVQTEAITWAIPAIFLGLVSVPILLQWYTRSELGDSYGRYKRYCNNRVGCDVGRIYGLFASIVFVAGAIFFVAFVTNFARFSESGIEVRRSLALRTRSYDYSRVKSIEFATTTRAPNGKIVPKPHYVILFDDGESWSTIEGLRTAVPELDKRIAEFVSVKSGQPIVKKPGLSRYAER